MLAALMSGQSITASELATIANVARSTASEHLARLVESRLVKVHVEGRHRYYSIASPLVAQMLESIAAVATLELPNRFHPKSARDRKLRMVRTCYDHLAGYVGVEITNALVRRNHVVLTQDGGEVTGDGREMLENFGINIAEITQRRKQMYCRPCLDWTERRVHLAGKVGAAIACRCLELGWFARMDRGRALEVTALGVAALAETFEITLPAGDW